MDSLNLKHLFAFSVALFACLCSTCVVADGADALLVSTISDGFIKWMPILTVGLLAVYVRNGRTVFHSVFCDSNALEVLRINARSVSAHVIHNVTVRYFSFSRVPSNSMRPATCPSKVEEAVSVAVKRTLPHNAVSLFFCFCVKTLGFFVSEVAHIKSPNGSNGNNWSIA
jgi:hypothetical protein